MAIWQFTLTPVDAARYTDGNVRTLRVAPEEAGAVPTGVQHGQLFQDLGSILPESRSWHARLRAWGDEQADDIKVWTDDDHTITEIRLRLDARDLSLVLIGKACALARKYGWLWATEEGSLIEATPQAVVNALTRSAAWQFVADPEGFLSRLAELRPEEP